MLRGISEKLVVENGGFVKQHGIDSVALVVACGGGLITGRACADDVFAVVHERGNAQRAPGRAAAAYGCLQAASALAAIFT